MALFGGSFDPPHRGHVAIARAAADHFSLDTVLFAPAGRQPLKSKGVTTAFDQRMTMTALACGEDTRFVVSDVDAPKLDGTPNYTVDTLTRLTTMMADATIFNLVGADSFDDLGHWREPERLLMLAEWIVVSRPGYSFSGEGAEPAGMILSVEQRRRVHSLDSVHEDVAARNLRERLRLGDPCRDVLPAAVAAYIQEHSLYVERDAGARGAEPLR